VDALPPYRFLFFMLKQLAPADDAMADENVAYGLPVLAQKAWNFINDSLRSARLTLHYTPAALAAAAVTLAARLTNIALPVVHDAGSFRHWFELYDVSPALMDEIVGEMAALYLRGQEPLRYTPLSQDDARNNEIMSVFAPHQPALGRAAPNGSSSGGVSASRSSSPAASAAADDDVIIVATPAPNSRATEMQTPQLSHMAETHELPAVLRASSSLSRSPENVSSSARRRRSRSKSPRRRRSSRSRSRTDSAERSERHATSRYYDRSLRREDSRDRSPSRRRRSRQRSPRRSSRHSSRSRSRHR
jgi:hypothetical protein